MNIYLDNASSSYPKAPGLGQAVLEFIESCGGNWGRGRADAVEEAVTSARKRLTELFHCDESRHGVFTSGATASINMLLRGLLKEGDHAVTTSMEHHAVMRTLKDMEKNHKISFSAVRADLDGGVSTCDIEKAITDKTKLIIVTHASNVCGTIQPIDEISRIAKKHNIYFAVDAAQTAGVLDIDAKKADFTAFAGHKGLLGPQGTGGFIVSDRLGEELTPIITGGTGSYSHLYEMPEAVPDKFEVGTLNLPGIAGLNHSLEFILKTGIDSIRHHEEEMTALLLDGLSKLPVKIIGRKDMKNRVGVVSFTAPYSNNEILAERMSERGIALRYGLHCAAAAHETLGTIETGAIRLSVGYFTTAEDINEVLKVLDELV